LDKRKTAYKYVIQNSRGYFWGDGWRHHLSAALIFDNYHDAVSARDKGETVIKVWLTIKNQNQNER